MIICVCSEFLGAVPWKLSREVDGFMWEFVLPGFKLCACDQYTVCWAIRRLMRNYLRLCVCSRCELTCDRHRVHPITHKVPFESACPFPNSFQGRLPMFLQVGVFIQQQQYTVRHRLPHRTEMNGSEGWSTHRWWSLADTSSYCLFTLQATSLISWCILKNGKHQRLQQWWYVRVTSLVTLSKDVRIPVFLYDLGMILKDHQFSLFIVLKVKSNLLQMLSHL